MNGKLLIKLKEKLHKINGEALIRNSKKKKIITLILLMFILIVVIMGYNYLNKPITKEVCLDKVYNALIEGDSKMLSKYVTVDGDKVNKEELVPVIDYYRDEEDKIESLINDLSKKNKSGNFSVENLEKNHVVNISSIDVSFIIDNEDAIVKVNSEDVYNKENKKMVPGVYEISYYLKTDLGNIEYTEGKELFYNGNVEISAKGKYLTLYSNFDDAKVFINDKDTGLFVSDIKGYGPIPTNEEINLYIQREFPWGIIKSDTVKVNNSNISIQIDMANKTLLNDVNNTVQEFYKSVFDALNNKDKYLITNATDDAKVKLFESINEKTTFFSNSYELSDLTMKIENSEFFYEDGIYKANVVTNISYTVSKKILSFIKNENEQMYLLNLVYDEGWIINGGEKLVVEE